MFALSIYCYSLCPSHPYLISKRQIRYHIMQSSNRRTNKSLYNPQLLFRSSSFMSVDMASFFLFCLESNHVTKSCLAILPKLWLMLIDIGSGNLPLKAVPQQLHLNCKYSRQSPLRNESFKRNTQQLAKEINYCGRGPPQYLPHTWPVIYISFLHLLANVQSQKNQEGSPLLPRTIHPARQLILCREGPYWLCSKRKGEVLTLRRRMAHIWQL